MLIQFSLDPEALPCNHGDLSMSVMIHRMVISEWRKHGVLVHSGGPLQSSAVFKAMESLPQECRKLWKTALSYNRHRQTTVPWDGTFPDDSVEKLDHLSGQFKLALLESTRAVVVGEVGVHDVSRVDQSLGNMELCKFHGIAESGCFRGAEELSNRPLTPGSACAPEWNKRYTDCLKQANHITIVDRYIFENHERRRRKKETSGLGRLLNDCFSRPRSTPVRVKLICATQSPNLPLSANDTKEINDFLHDLATRYIGGGIGSLDCYFLHDRDFAKHCHTRYFRTDYLVFGIDGGLDAFGGTTSDRGTVVWRNDTMNEKYFSEQEAKLQSDAFQVVNLI